MRARAAVERTMGPMDPQGQAPPGRRGARLGSTSTKPSADQPDPIVGSALNPNARVPDIAA
eukprot:10407646-Heterocapsa_arctica.AAC.1